MSNQVYVFGSPSTVLYGEGCFNEVGERLAKYGRKKALIVTDDTLVKTGIVDRMSQVLSASGISSCVYSGVNSEPTNIQSMGHRRTRAERLRSGDCPRRRQRD